MVVIPKGRRVLMVGVKIGGRFSRDIPIFRITIAVGRCLGAMEVNYAANLRKICFRAMNGVIDGQKMLFRQTD